MDEEGFAIEEKYFELGHKLFWMAKFRTLQFAVRVDAKVLLADGVKNSTTYSNAHVLIEKYTQKDALQACSISPREGVKTLLFNLEREVIADTIQQGKIDSLLMRNIDTLPQYKRFIHSFTE